MYILTTREERKMVTKEDVENAKAEWQAAFDAADEAWDKYFNLKEEFESGN